MGSDRGFILQRELGNNPVPEGFKSLLPGVYVPEESSRESTYIAFDKLFPEGLRTDEEGLAKYLELVGAKASESGNCKSFGNTLERLGFRWIDRGTYASPLRIPVIEGDLRDRIIARIESEDTVSYVSILAEFQEELSSIGITNRYILKSAVDPIIPDGYRSSRDYIRKTSSTSGDSAFKRYVAEASIVDIPDVQSRFPGMSRHSVQVEIYKRVDLLKVSHDIFITPDFLGLDARRIDRIEKAIEECLGSDDSTSMDSVLEKVERIAPDIVFTPALLASIIKMFFSDLYVSNSRIIQRKKEGFTSVVASFRPRNKKGFTLSEFNAYLRQNGRKGIPLYEACTLLRECYILVVDSTFAPFDRDRYERRARELVLEIENSGPLSSSDISNRIIDSGATPQSILGIAVCFKDMFRVSVKKDTVEDVSYTLDVRKRR